RYRGWGRSGIRRQPSNSPPCILPCWRDDKSSVRYWPQSHCFHYDNYPQLLFWLGAQMKKALVTITAGPTDAQIVPLTGAADNFPGWPARGPTTAIKQSNSIRKMRWLTTTAPPGTPSCA